MIGLKEYRKLERVIEDLRFLSECGAIVIVEGKKDAEALRNLGVRGRIVEASLLPNHVLADKLRGNETIILTDWDSRGEMLKNTLAKLLDKPNLTIRSALTNLTSKYIKSVEELPKLLEELERIHKKRI